MPAADIPLPYIVRAANVCDESVDFPVTGAPAVTLPRYRAGIVISTAADPRESMNELVEAMAGRHGWAGGTWRLMAGHMPAPVFAMDEAWLARRIGVDGGIEPGPTIAFTNGVPRGEKVNRVSGRCVDPAQRWQVLPFPAVEDPVLIAREGSVYPLEVEYQAVNTITHAQHLSRVAIKRGQAPLRATAQCNLFAYPVELFDVGTLTLPRYGIAGKTMEVVGWRWSPAEGPQLELLEITDAIFAADGDLSGRDPAPNTNLPSPWLVEEVQGLAVTSGTTELVDGSVLTRTLVRWDPALSPNIAVGGKVVIEFALVEDGPARWQLWEEEGSQVQAVIPGLLSGSFYLFRARFRTGPPLAVRGPWCPQVLHQVAVPAGGGAGLSSYMIEIYTQAATQPATPQGGQYTFVGDVFVPPGAVAPTPEGGAILSSLLAWWSFDENDASSSYADSHGSNSLTLRTEAASTATSAISVIGGDVRHGRAANMARVIRRAAFIPRSNTALDLPNASFTMGGWFVMNAEAETTVFLMGRIGTGNTMAQAYIATDGTVGNQLRGYVTTDGTSATRVQTPGISATSGWSPGEIQFITFSLDRAANEITLRLRRPGANSGNVIKVSAAFPGALFTGATAANFALGHSLSSDNTWFAGTANRNGVQVAEECFVTLHALTDEEFDYLYNDGAGRSYAQLSVGGVGAWSRDQPNGSGTPTWASRYLVQTDTPDVPFDIPLLGSWSVPNKHVQDGQGGAVLYITATSQTFTFGASGLPVPASQTITFTAVATTLAGSPVFTATLFDAAGASLGPATLGGTGTSRTLTVANFGAAQRVVVVVTQDGYTDQITVVRLRDGAGNVAGYLTNESAIVDAAADGTVSSFDGAGGTFVVFDGLTPVTGGASVTYSVQSETGVDVSIASTGVYTVNSMSANAGNATLRAVYSGVTLDKVYSIAKSRQGQAGPPALSATLSTYVVLFRSDSEGVVEPGQSFDVTMTVMVGSTDDTSAWTFTRASSDASITTSIAGATVTITGIGGTVEAGSVAITATKAGAPTQTLICNVGKLKAGGLPLGLQPNLNGLVSNNVATVGTASASLIFDTEGRTRDHTGLYGPDYFRPPAGGVGAGLWLRVTKLDGTAMSGPVDSWVSLATERTYTVERSTIGVSTAAIAFEIATNDVGAGFTLRGTATITAERE